MATSSMTVLDVINECCSFPYSKLYMELMKESYEQQLNRHYIEAMEYRKKIETLAYYDESYNIDTSMLVEYNESAIRRFYEDGDDDNVDAPPAKSDGLVSKAWTAIKKFFGWIVDGAARFFKFISGKIIAGYRKIFGAPDEYAEKVRKHVFTLEDVNNLINASTNVDNKLDVEFWRNPPMKYPAGKCPQKIKFGKDVKDGKIKVAVVNLLRFIFSWSQDGAECIIFVHNNNWKALLPDSAKNADDNFVSNFADIRSIIDKYVKLEESDTDGPKKLLGEIKRAVGKSKGTPIAQRGFKFKHSSKEVFESLGDDFNTLKSDLNGATGEWRTKDGTTMKELTDLLSNVTGNLIAMMTTFKTVSNASLRAGNVLRDIVTSEQITNNNVETES